MDKNNKPIIILDFPGHLLAYDLAKQMSKTQKNKIVHIHNPFQLGPKSSFKKLENLDIIRVNKFFSRNHYKRLFDEFIFTFLLLYNIIKIRPSIVISANNPLIPQFFLWIYCKLANVKFIFWLQDITSIAVNNILKRQKNIFTKIVSKIFHFMEFSVLRNSDHIITITPDFDNILLKNGVKNDRIQCIPNWAPINNIPALPKKNNFSIKNKLDKSFNIMYSGTLGFKHNPEILFNLGVSLSNQKINTKIVIVSEGPVVEYLKGKVSSHGLRNFVFLPFQNFEIFPEVLATADVNLVMLEKDSSDFCVPSKLLSILCSGRIPIVYVANTNLASKIVVDNNCGFSVKSEKELQSIIHKIINNIDSYDFIGKNGISYAEDNFKIEDITNKFLRVIKNLS